MACMREGSHSGQSHQTVFAADCQNSNSPITAPDTMAYDGPASSQGLRHTGEENVLVHGSSLEEKAVFCFTQEKWPVE